MHTNDLLESAQRACDSYWMGSDKTKINLREAMSDLRVCVDAETKRRAQADTTTITRPAREHA